MNDNIPAAGDVAVALLDFRAQVNAHVNAIALTTREAQLAQALVDFLNLTGGSDGMRCGFGNPIEVRQAALAALSNSGIAYGQNTKPLPGLDFVDTHLDHPRRENMEEFYERQRGTLHPGGIRTPGFPSLAERQSLQGAAVLTYIAPNAAREFDDQHFMDHDGRRI